MQIVLESAYPCITHSRRNTKEEQAPLHPLRASGGKLNRLGKNTTRPKPKGRAAVEETRPYSWKQGERDTVVYRIDRLLLNVECLQKLAEWKEVQEELL